MNKNTLLTAAAFGALALAGAANASELTAAKVSNQTLGITAGTTSTFYTVATESISATAANRQTTSTATHNITTTRPGATGAVFIPGTGGTTSYSATLTLTGATFTNAIVAANQVVVTTGTCVVGAPSVVAGGGAGQNTVTIFFTVAAASGCTATAGNAAEAVTFDAPFTLDAAASTASASVGFVISSTGAAYGGANGAGQLVQKTAAYSAGVSPLPQAPATGLPTSLSLTSTPPYSALVPNGFTNDNIIGSVTAANTVAGATTTGAIYADLSSGAVPSLTYSLIVATNGGQFTAVQPRVQTTDGNALAGGASSTVATVNASNTTYTFAGLSGARTVYVVATGVAASSAQATSGTATFTNGASTTIAPPAASVINIETVTLQGTNFIAPWVGNAGASSTTVIRVGNSGAQTGPVTLTILSPVTAANGVVTQAPVTRSVCSSANLAKLANIGASNELQVTSADLATCFGTAFTRADIRVSVQAVANNLTAKMRITNTAGTTEQSLGAISADVATTN